MTVRSEAVGGGAAGQLRQPLADEAAVFGQALGRAVNAEIEVLSAERDDGLAGGLVEAIARGLERGAGMERLQIR